MLLQQASSAEYLIRFASIFFTNRLFPFKSPEARFICLVCMDDVKLEVKEEARRGLTPFTVREGDIFPDNSVEYPSFVEMLTYVHQQFRYL